MIANYFETKKYDTNNIQNESQKMEDLIVFMDLGGNISSGIESSLRENSDACLCHSAAFMIANNYLFFFPDNKAQQIEVMENIEKVYRPRL